MPNIPEPKVSLKGRLAVPLRDMLRRSQLKLSVKCPNCPTEMTVRTVLPSLLDKDFLEITYACPRCQAETTRYLKPDAKLNARGEDGAR
jgi:hypothetical protein